MFAPGERSRSRRAFPSSHAVDVARARHNRSLGWDGGCVCGALSQDQGKLDEAEPLMLRDLKISEKTLGANHPDVAISCNNLAQLYKVHTPRDEGTSRVCVHFQERGGGIVDGRAGRACAIEKRVPILTRRRRVRVGVLSQAQGKLDEAEPLYLRCLTIDEAIYGPQHPEIAADCNNLGAFYYEQAKHAEAKPLFERALAIYTATLGPDHPDTKDVEDWLDDWPEETDDDSISMASDPDEIAPP